MSTPAGIDPRGPRFAATITSALLLIAFVLSLIGLPIAEALAQRAADPGFIALVVIALLFAWGVISPATQPWSVLFRRAVRPRLAPPTELEDPRPPRFAQGVGLLVVGIGIVLHLIGVPLALPIAAGAAFVAAFLNAAFAFCLGCQIYLLLQRAGLLGRGAATV